jgi:hypothetical protein
MSDLLYVYAILPAPAAVTLEEQAIQGIGGGRVWPVLAGDLAAALSAVPEAEFDEAPLNAHVRDLDWLAPRAAAHQEVNARLFAAGHALIPLAFGTVFRDAAGVEHLLRSQRSALLDRLARIRGRAEWVLTVQRDAAAALAALERSSAALAALRQQIAAAPPGRAYLLQRRFDTVRRQELLAQDARVVQRVQAALAPLAVQRYLEPVVPETEGGPLVRWSMLVERAGEAEWRAAVEQEQGRRQAEGYAIRLSGPWPAYRFSSLEQQAAGA